MTPETFFANFGHLADAPNGVQKLREMILQLAVQGKLVPQDPSDEPASLLIGQFEATKDKLVREGRIRLPKSLPEIPKEEFPFELPTAWEWRRFGELGLIGSSSRVHKKDWKSKGVPFLRAREIVKLSQFGTVNNELFISEELFQSLSSGGLVPEENDLMITGVGTIGISYIVRESDKFYFKDASVLIFKNYYGLYPKYLDCLLRTPYWIDTIHKESMGTTVHTLTISRANEVPVPLPPLEEQKRIVAKVDQLMALCDQLEARQQKQQQGRVRLNNASLDALLAAREPEEFATHWQRISTNFDLLYDYSETIPKLRAAILQLAVQGKLVPQDPNDEPASVLLERIKAEKERLVKTFKARQQSPSSPIANDRLPFSLPSGWSWMCLEDYGIFVGGGTPSKQNPAYWQGDIPWVSPKDMKVQYLSDSIDHVSKEAIENSSAKLIPKGALLMVVRGMILLHSFPVARTTCAVTVNQDMKALICALPETSEYLLKLLIGEKGRVLELVERSSHGTCRLDADSLYELVIALPPLEEQKRIVAKVDQLMALCDELEAKLNQAKVHSEKLMQATVRQVLVA